MGWYLVKFDTNKIDTITWIDPIVMCLLMIRKANEELYKHVLTWDEGSKPLM